MALTSPIPTTCIGGTLEACALACPVHPPVDFNLCVEECAIICGPVVRSVIGGSLQESSHIWDTFQNRRVAYITAAGTDPVRDAESYRQTFENLGINATWVPIYGSGCSSGVFDPEVISIVEGANAVFMSGGQSGRLQSCLLGDFRVDGLDTVPSAGSPLLDAVLAKNLIGGTSAGAMVQPFEDLLITGYSKNSYCAVQENDVYYKEPGLKVSALGIADSHFCERGRQGRLLVLAMLTGAEWAFGVDENTAYEDTDGEFRVVGESSVVVYQAGGSLINATYHQLTDGDIIRKDGTIDFASWKSPCSSPIQPEPSMNIFGNGNDDVTMRVKSAETAMYEKPNFSLVNYHGNNPAVRVEFGKTGNTRVVCGTKDGVDFVSFSDMFVSMSVEEDFYNAQGIPQSCDASVIQMLDA